jgi:hydroxyacylglutathione hydrolase
MLIERSMQADWLSNAYLVADEDSGEAVVIDSGGPAEPLLEVVERNGLQVRTLLLTHHHQDHVAENHVWKERHSVEILAHPLEVLWV